MQPSEMGCRYLPTYCICDTSNGVQDTLAAPLRTRDYEYVRCFSL